MKIIYKKEELRPSPEIETQLQEKQVNYWTGKWQMQCIGEVCANIEEWEITGLRLGENKEAKILKQIQHIKFRLVELLNLGANDLQTIEGLSRVDMPSLKQLYIWENKLMLMADLKKSYWPQFEKLSITNNEVKDGMNLNLMSTRNMKTVYFEIQDSQAEQTCDMNWMAKLESPVLASLDMKSRERIVQNKLHTKLRTKYNGLILYAKIHY